MTSGREGRRERKLSLLKPFCSPIAQVKWKTALAVGEREGERERKGGGVKTGADCAAGSRRKQS